MLALLLLAGCCRRPSRRAPALWQVDRAASGERGWLFGTIHALPAPADWRMRRRSTRRWRSPIGWWWKWPRSMTTRRTATVFAELARNARPCRRWTQRVPADLRGRLAALLKDAGLAAADFAEIETWAAALMLHQAMQADWARQRQRRSTARLLRQRGSKPVIELEGAAGQLAIFDRLPEADQRDLLAAVVARCRRTRGEGRSLDSSVAARRHGCARGRDAARACSPIPNCARRC